MAVNRIELHSDLIRRVKETEAGSSATLPYSREYIDGVISAGSLVQSGLRFVLNKGRNSGTMTSTESLVLQVARVDSIYAIELADRLYSTITLVEVPQ